jgi:hypothetical protein
VQKHLCSTPWTTTFSENRGWYILSCMGRRLVFSATSSCHCREAFEIQEAYPPGQHIQSVLCRIAHFRYQQPSSRQLMINGREEAAKYFNISITIMANFHKVIASCGQFGINGRHPILMCCQIACSDAECVSSRAVYIRLKEHVIDLGVEVGPTVPSIYYTLAGLSFNTAS